MNPISIVIGVSPRLRILLWLTHGVALAAWFMALHALWLRIAGTVTLMVSALWYDHATRHAPLTAIEADQNGYRLLWRGVWQPAILLEALITAPLTVINFRSNGRRIDAVLLPDNVESEAYRRLRVWLRWGRMEEDADPL